MELPDSLDVHIDIMCPYAFQTSHWFRALRDEIGLQVNWRFFSLEEVNRRDEQKHPWERDWSYGWSMMRIGVVLRRLDMMLLDRWYQVAGSALHVDGKKPHVPDVARHLLTTMDMDPGIVDQAMSDPTTHDEVRTEHDRVIAAGGFGVPTIFFPDGDRLFGPVLMNPPTGQAAVRLFELVNGWREFPHLYELQRPKNQDDLHLIGTTFRPYVEARDWITIQKETP